MSSSTHLSPTIRTVQWRNPQTKERLTLKCAPPHEDGRLRVICDLCARPCVVASATQLGNFAAHRGSGACAKRAGVSGAVNSASASGSVSMVKSASAVKVKVKSEGAAKGKITSHFAPSTSSRASSAAISIASASPPVTASSTSPQTRPMEIDLTSPSPEPEPAPKKSKITAGATAATARVVDTSLLDRLEARADGMDGPRSASSERLRNKSKPEAASTSATTSKPKPAQPISAISIPAAAAPPTTSTAAASSSTTADVPACTVCKRPNATPTYKLCEACRTNFRMRSRIKAEVKRAAEASSAPIAVNAVSTSYNAAASTSSSAHSAPATKTVSIPAAQTYSTPTSDLPACTSCRRPNLTPKYKLCDACRDYSRQRSRIDAERKRASAALLLAEARGNTEEIKRAREEKERAMGMLPKRRDEEGEGGVEKPKPGRKRKRVAEEHSPSPFRTPDILFDPDECGTAAAAYAILKAALNASPPPVKPPRAPLPQPKLNIRLTWAVVADGSVSHRMRIEGVVRELRRVGVKFSSLGKTQEPGSSRYAPYNVLTDRFRCKCTSSPKPVVRRQSNLSNFFTKNSKGKAPARMEEEEEIEEEEDVLMLVPSALVKGTNSTSTSTSSTSASGARKSVGGAGAGGAEAEEKCGGHVYVSSEWDVKSHPAGLRGQRVVVWVVHEGGDDPVQ